jgi:hypothetical protein
MTLCAISESKTKSAGEFGKCDLGRAFDQGAVVPRRHQNNRPNLLPLLGLAIIILLVFAWTYICDNILGTVLRLDGTF